MESEPKEKRLSPLAEAEMEVLEEGREWMRRRLQEKLQKRADRQGSISPPQRRAAAGHSAAEDHAEGDGR